MKILLLDNYDSFTYNLYHSIKSVSKDVTIDVVRNDAISLDNICKYNKVILSPGPGLPSEAGLLMKVIERVVSQNISLLGVCLGHQAICEFFGATLYNHEKVFHGVASEVFFLKREGIFQGLPEKIMLGRYHSWSVEKKNFPQELEITAEDNEGTIMAMKHKRVQVFGVQFHPESYLSPRGNEIIKNWIDLKK